jgi:hypothetical protein
MITATEFEALVEELLTMEGKLKVLGEVTFDTPDGPYAMCERALSDDFPSQKEYNDLLSIYNEKKRLVEAFDMIARYKLAMK